MEYSSGLSGYLLTIITAKVTICSKDNNLVMLHRVVSVEPLFIYLHNNLSSVKYRHYTIHTLNITYSYRTLGNKRNKTKFYGTKKIHIDVARQENENLVSAMT